MLRIALCDDEKAIRDQLRRYLERFAAQTGLQYELQEYSSATELLQSYPAGVDLLLLDIYMEGIDGMAAARQIRTFDPQVCLIFITTMYQCAIEGYAVRAFGFIKKPVNYPELCHELDCAVRQIERTKASENFLTIRDGQTVSRIPMEGIRYCEVRNHTILVRVDGRTAEYRGQMNTLEEQLLPHGFFRCHSSFLVNSRAIRQIEPTQLILSDGSRVPISQRRRKDFMAALSAYIGEQI